MYINTSNQEKMELGCHNLSCNWGTHIAGLYETEEERDEIIFGFLTKGAMENDLQLYVPNERSKKDFEEEIVSICPSCESKIHNHEHFQVMSAAELYYPDGSFSASKMNSGLTDFFTNSQNKEKRNIRATAEMTWALEAIPGVEELMVYENGLNEFIPGKPWISICLYNLTKFSGDIIMKVLQTHPFVITNGSLIQNQYFIDPKQWISKN